MVAGLERDIQRGPQGQVARFFQSHRLGMGQTGSFMGAPSHDLPPANNHRTDRRVGPGSAGNAAGQRQRLFHEATIQGGLIGPMLRQTILDGHKSPEEQNLTGGVGERGRLIRCNG